MKAIVQDKYGSPDVLELKEIDKPIPKDDDVLVRVRAAAVNPLDWHSMKGLPYFVRMGNGLLAKSFGADVTGVCSTRNVDMVRSIGADQVIDYTREDFTRSKQRYDLIVDMAGTRSLSDCRRALTARGTYVVVGAPSGRWFTGPDRFLKALVLSLFVSQRMVPCLTTASKHDLVVLKDLIEAGKVTPVIDRSYRLVEVPEAIRYLEEGHARGKVVINV
jgi:NADPH:quinone reductase-like Zn-dependent oxidoreductase